MQPAIPMVEIRRGDRLESQHCGHAVICDARGEIVAAWGDPELVIWPRSSCKMLQALPLVESGAADGLDDARLALACASHQGAAMHTEAVAGWLAEMELEESDLRCGSHEPHDRAARDALIRAGHAPGQVHNNCSGKHTGFLALARRLGGGPEYIEIDHPVQRAVRATFEELTQTEGLGHAIDGCSAPNFATTLHGLARAMAAFATARPDGGVRAAAAARLVDAMARHPALVAGEGRACTELMRAAGGRAAFKTGAEGVYIAILPDLGFGVAVKIADGATRAAEAALAALLVRLEVLERDDPAVRARLGAVLRNWRGREVGEIRAAAGFA